ncbi:hypothetical protein [Nostoc sp.]|uniref:hypothetical protein n=1 Tax=Nostoc sp. TaxID=1180 RepID=UPI002FFA4D62
MFEKFWANIIATTQTKSTSVESLKNQGFLTHVRPWRSAGKVGKVSCSRDF